ncbi:helix-turn-helix domain-containing protein [Streptomyces sp. NPDC052309]|uniref:helix-turn-helix domain-containing protein n=1 Tax=Streptomyces sp. NPDC052309 TaxID=3155421 RepID=UPI0034330621
MTEQHPSAHAHPASGRSARGVEHCNVPHTENFTVVGNHLLQHPDLSLTAIGLAVHIQSLPARTPIGIKSLAAKFPEGEIRIAAALRELEEHGYLARTKERLQSGRVVTRTVSFNRPGAVVAAAAAPAAAEPETEKPQLHPKAARLLARIGVDEPRLTLTARDVSRLAPAVSAWLDRGVPATTVERVLTTGLPQDPIRHPAAFLAHRLTTDLPPSLPVPGPTTSPVVHGPDPLQTCDGCDRAFRAPQPGHCRDCRTTGRKAA